MLYAFRALWLSLHQQNTWRVLLSSYVTHLTRSIWLRGWRFLEQTRLHSSRVHSNAFLLHRLSSFYSWNLELSRLIIRWDTSLWSTLLWRLLINQILPKTRFYSFCFQLLKPLYFYFKILTSSTFSLHINVNLSYTLHSWSFSFVNIIDIDR